MDTLTRGHLDVLANTGRETCVSLLMPTHRIVSGATGDSLRLRQLIERATEQLVRRGWRRSDANRLLSPAVKRLEDRAFWNHQGDGLAIYLAPDVRREFRLPDPIEEQFAVGPEFELLPLVPIVQTEQEFIVLAASQNTCRLFRGNRLRLEPVAVEGLPAGLHDALGRQRERQLNVRTMPVRPQRPTGQSIAVFHGDDQNVKELDAEAYLRKVADVLETALQGENLPLVFAGPEELFPIFRRVTHYEPVVDEFVPGSPDRRPVEELHALAWELARPFHRAAWRISPEMYGAAQQAGRGTEEPERVLTAALNGLVDCLFVRRGARDRREILVCDGVATLSAANGEEQNIPNVAAVNVLRNRGDVYVLEDEEFPASGDMAAVLRAPLASITAESAGCAPR